MSSDASSYIHSDITDLVIRSAFSVHNALGAGFLEKVYENALVIELRELGLLATQQPAVKVMYKGTVVGDFFPDLMVENKVIVEIKAQPEILKVHEIQLVNYLRASGWCVGVLLNFGERVTVRRKHVGSRHSVKESILHHDYQ